MTDTFQSPQVASAAGSQPLHENKKDSGSQFRPRVHAPRPVGYEFILGLVTFNVYYCFWAVGRAKDLKNMRSNSFEPWLWFFAPLVGIIQLFAFARMFSELKVIEGERLHLHWQRYGWLWILAIFISGATGTLVGFELIPEWLFQLSILIDTILLALVHIRFNRLKIHDANLLDFYGRSTWFYWWEWVLMGLAALVWGALAFDAWDRQKSIIKEVPTGYTYKANESKFKFSISGPGWQNVEIGSYSSGDSEVEFGNAASTGYLIVFKHGFDYTMNDAASFRYADMQTEFTTVPKCSEKRELSPDEKFVTSTMTCLSKNVLAGNFTISKLIEIDDRIYELLGRVSAQNKSFSREMKTLIEAAESFSAIAVEKEEEG